MLKAARKRIDAGVAEMRDYRIVMGRGKLPMINFQFNPENPLTADEL